MATTFLKRQKEMKRLEKQREKAERRAQRKLAKAGRGESQVNNATVTEVEFLEENLDSPTGQEPQI